LGSGPILSVFVNSLGHCSIAGFKHATRERPEPAKAQFRITPHHEHLDRSIAFPNGDTYVTTEALAVIDQVLHRPGSWCNLVYEPIEDDDIPDESALFGFLAARGPANPLATIMAAQPGKRPKPAEIGIQHRAGTKAAAQLREANLLLPQGATVSQDHPRRGLVVRWPENAETATLIAWLFPSMRVLGRASTTNDILYECTSVR